MLYAAPPEGDGYGRCIASLVSEDDLTTREYLTLLLQTSGYDAWAVSTGADGIGAVASEHVQAILLDRRLPDVDGILLCPLLRHLVGVDAPIFMMTADAEVGLLAAAQAAGATRLLHKPFMPRTLLDALSTALGAE